MTDTENKLTPAEEKLRVQSTRSKLDRVMEASDPRHGRRPQGARDFRDESRTMRVPLDADPDVIVEKTSEADAARHALRRLHSTWSSIAELAGDRKRVPMDKLAELVQPAMSKALDAAEAAIARLHADEESLNEHANQVIARRGDSTEQGEIRAYWRTRADQDGFQAAILKAVRDDAATACAVLCSQPYLSGLDENSAQLVRDTAMREHQPEILTRIEIARSARSRVEQVSERFAEEVQKRLEIWTSTKNPAEDKLRELGGAR